jgi:hypothetical protein
MTVRIGGRSRSPGAVDGGGKKPNAVWRLLFAADANHRSWAVNFGLVPKAPAAPAGTGDCCARCEPETSLVTLKEMIQKLQHVATATGIARANDLAADQGLFAGVSPAAHAPPSTGLTFEWVWRYVLDDDPTPPSAEEWPPQQKKRRRRIGPTPNARRRFIAAASRLPRGSDVIPRRVSRRAALASAILPVSMPDEVCQKCRSKFPQFQPGRLIGISQIAKKPSAMPAGTSTR